MGEVIQFPNPDETSDDLFIVCDDTEEEDLVILHSVITARNIARLVAADWPGRVFTVTRGGREVFRAVYTEEE